MASLSGLPPVEWVDAAGLRVALREWGAGPDVAVLVHGLGSSSRCFAPLARILGRSLRVIAVDLPGFGESSERLARITIPILARTVHRALRARKIEKAIWIGHSMGGQIALRQALASPGSVERLVLLAPAGIERFSPTEARWLTGMVTTDFVMRQTPAQIRANVAMSFHHLPPSARLLADERVALTHDPVRLRGFAEACQGAVRAMLEGEVADELGHIRAPCLALFAASDRLIPNPVLHPRLDPAVIAEETRRLLPDCETHLMPEVGHMLHFEEPERCGSHITRFLHLRTECPTGT